MLEIKQIETNQETSDKIGNMIEGTYKTAQHIYPTCVWTQKTRSA